MIAFLADENLNANIVRGLLRRVPEIDLLTVRDVGLDGQIDSDVISWSAANNRVVVSHDVRTLIHAATQRLRSGEPMAGLLAVPQGLGIGAAILDLELVATCADLDDLNGQIWYLPL